LRALTLRVILMSDRLVFPEGKQGFLLLSYPRSGSHFLRSLLNAHPAITCHDEVFDPSRFKESGGVQARLNEYWQGPLTGMIAHACTGWPKGRRTRFADLFKQVPLDTKVVCIQRWNLLRRYASGRLARKSVWNVTRSKRDAQVLVTQARDARVMLDPARLRGDIHTARVILATRGCQFLNTYRVSYEQLCLHTEFHMRRIYEHLGADPDACENIEAETLPLHMGRSLRDMIINYESLKRRFADTDIACYFNE